MNQDIKVLIVDDEEGLADFMQNVLVDEGYTAFMETDGLSAINFFKSERPDIILIDVALGDSKVDGTEVLRKIKEIDQNAICIMITRITDEETVKRSKDLGAMHYVLKPLKDTDVLNIVTEAANIISKRRAANG